MARGTWADGLHQLAEAVGGFASGICTKLLRLCHPSSSPWDKNASDSPSPLAGGLSLLLPHRLSPSHPSPSQRNDINLLSSRLESPSRDFREAHFSDVNTEADSLWLIQWTFID